MGRGGTRRVWGLVGHVGRLFLSGCWFASLLVEAGCGTTRLTETPRSASEELLLSTAVDRSVSQLNFQLFAGQKVFLDTSNLGDVQQRHYLTSALRQHLLASGALLAKSMEEAEVVVEARAGSVATSRHDSLVGIPQTTLPVAPAGVPAILPEIAIYKKQIHLGVAKVSVFAYRPEEGAALWQSGVCETQSTSRSTWLLGMGPFQSGDVVLQGGDMSLGNWLPSSDRHGTLESEMWLGDQPDRSLVPAPLVPALKGEAVSAGEPALGGSLKIPLSLQD
jgi:hypothetical protein